MQYLAEAVLMQYEPALPPSPHSAPLHSGSSSGTYGRERQGVEAPAQRGPCDRPCSVRKAVQPLQRATRGGRGRGEWGGWLTWDDRMPAKDKALGGHEGVEGPDACRIGNLSRLKAKQLSEDILV